MVVYYKFDKLNEKSYHGLAIIMIKADIQQWMLIILPIQMKMKDFITLLSESTHCLK